MFRKSVLLAATVSLLVVVPPGQSFAVKPDRNEAPVVTAFDVEPASASPVPILTFLAEDSDGSVTGYLVTESSSEPSANDPDWSSTAPTTYTTASVGLVTLYAWAKDDDDAVSNSMSDTVDIPQPPLDADTLDGLDSTDFALASHLHGMADVSGLTAVLDSKASLGHDHDSSYQSHYANVIVVSSDGNGDFVDPAEAVASITDASETNPYLVKVMPGSYEVLGPVVLYPYIDLEGSGKDVTKIFGTSNLMTHGAVNLTNGPSEVRDLTVETYPILGCAATHYVYGIQTGNAKDVSIRNVKVYVHGAPVNIGIQISALSEVEVTGSEIIVDSSETCGSWAVGIYFWDTGQTATLRNCSVRATGNGTTYGLRTIYDGVAHVIDSDIYGDQIGLAAGMSFTNHYSTIKVHNSRISGGVNSVGVNTGDTLLGAGSQLIGPVLNYGTFQCVNCYDGSFNPLP